VTLPRKRIGRSAGSALVFAACAVALTASVAVAHRAAGGQAPPRGNIPNGYRVFNDYFCADCHAMKAAGPASYRGYNVCDGDTACNAGVNFNRVHVQYQVAIAVITSGLPAALPVYPTQMPAFRKVLTNTQIRDVAAFLAKYSGSYTTCRECKGITPSGFPTG
jgi:mono/diheme cytochrome c family protein